MVGVCVTRQAKLITTKPQNHKTRLGWFAHAARPTSELWSSPTTLTLESSDPGQAHRLVMQVLPQKSHSPFPLKPSHTTGCQDPPKPNEPLRPPLPEDDLFHRKPTDDAETALFEISDALAEKPFSNPTAASPSVTLNLGVSRRLRLTLSLETVGRYDEFASFSNTRVLHHDWTATQF